MPCNSDYMYPTQSEIHKLHAIELELKAVADKMVFNADVIRDVIIENKGKAAGATLTLATGQISKMVGIGDLTRQGDVILDKMKQQYAYGQTSTPTVDVYNKAKDQYSYICEIATRFLAGEKIYAKEYKDVEKQQIHHRQGDIQRLITVFNDTGNWNMLKKVINVDFTQPLEPQLGFSPDDF